MNRIAITRGFTLLELLVVVAIIALLAGYVGPRYFAQLGKSEVGAAKAQIVAFSRALDQFRIDVGRFPTTDEGLLALYRNASIAKWAGPYLQKEPPLDPWGKQYVYRFPSSKVGQDYDIVSFGKDAAPGGDGENADVSN